MMRLGVSETYVDAFCGRVPKSVLARHYTDFSVERLNEVYEKTGLNVLNQAIHSCDALIVDSRALSPFLLK